MRSCHPKRLYYQKPTGTLDRTGCPVDQKETQGFKSWLQNSVHNIISCLQHVSSDISSG